MNTVIAYSVSSLILIISTIVFMNYVLVYRAHNKWLIWLVAAFYLGLTTYIFFSKAASFWNSVAFISMIISFGLFYSNWKRVIVILPVVAIILFISEAVSFYFGELINNSIQSNWTKKYILNLCNILSKLTVPATQYILAKLFRTVFSRRSLSGKYLFACFSIPASSVFIFYYIYLSSERRTVSLVYSLISSVVLMIMNYTILMIFMHLTEHYNARIENQIYLEQVDAFNYQQMSQVQAATEIRGVRHDLNDILLSVKIGFEQGNSYGALAVIDRYVQQVNPACMVSQTGNGYIDNVINYKSELASAYGIRFHVHSKQLRPLAIEWMDISVILSNALNNATEACMSLKKDRAKTVCITLETLSSMLRISIANPYDGKITKDEKGGFLTTKPDQQNHGHGINGIIRLLENNQGIWEFKLSENVFELVFMVPQCLS